MVRKIKQRSNVKTNRFRQFQELQEVLQVQDEIAAATFTAAAGGGAVTAVVTGERRVKSLTIAPEVVSQADVDMLQDLVVAAVNSALDQVDQALAARMGVLTNMGLR